MDTLLFSLYIIIAVFVSWIWVDYYRKIDIYQKDKFYILFIMFLLGATSVFAVDIVSSWVYVIDAPFEPDSHLRVLYHTIVQVGLVEELVKLTAFLIGYTLLRKQLEEPIDVIAAICTTALGFAAVENIMYFELHNGISIVGRSALSAVGHMTFSAFIGYGFILSRFHEESTFAPILKYTGIAILSHGIYDYIILSPNENGFVEFFSLLFFFLYAVSLFAQIINNALNNSPHFTYSKVIRPAVITTHLLSMYLIVIGLFTITLFIKGTYTGVQIAAYTVSNVMRFMIPIVIFSMRLGRFRLEKGVWHPLGLRLPFKMYAIDGKTYFQIEGDDGDEHILSGLMYTEFEVHRANVSRGNIEFPFKAKMTKKLYTPEMRSIYLVECTEGTNNGQSFFIFEYRHSSHSKSDKYVRLKIASVPEEMKLNDIWPLKEIGFRDFGLYMINGIPKG